MTKPSKAPSIAEELDAELASILEESQRDKAAIEERTAERIRKLLTRKTDAGASQEPEWITLEQASALRRVSRDTMAAHAERHGLGTFSNRRWRIDKRRVEALNAGHPMPPLNPHPDRSIPRNTDSIDARPDDSPDAS